jgi:hypothetical protein
MDLLEKTGCKYNNYYFDNKYSNEEFSGPSIDAKDYLSYIYKRIS